MRFSVKASHSYVRSDSCVKSCGEKLSSPAAEFLAAMRGSNFNLDQEDAETIVKHFFGEDPNTFENDDEMKFADFARKVQQLLMLPRMRGEI